MSGLEPAVRDQLAEQLGEDPVVSTLLLIHDLHPVALEDRVQQALDSVRPYMESHGGNVELLSVQDGIARIHLRGSCSDCSASSVTLELAIKKALEEAAPDLLGLEVEGVAAADDRLGAADGHREHRVRAAGDDVRAGAGMGRARRRGRPGLGGVAAILSGGGRAGGGQRRGHAARLPGSLRRCGEAAARWQLTAGALACPHCERSFFLPRAGRSLDDEQLQLEPVPLLHEQGRVKVAVGAA